MPMSPNMVLSGGPIYLGGVPDTVNLIPELPVKTSLTGGIHELKINDVLVMLLFFLIDYPISFMGSGCNQFCGTMLG